MKALFHEQKGKSYFKIDLDKLLRLDFSSLPHFKQSSSKADLKYFESTQRSR